jgi:hypothetical protein
LPSETLQIDKIKKVENQNEEVKEKSAGVGSTVQPAPTPGEAISPLL